MWLNQNNEKDNELGGQSQSNPSIGAGAGDAGTSSGGTTAGNTPSNTPIANKPQTTQKFATVQDYLKTNQPQSEDLGQKFTNTLDTSFGQQTAAIDTAANKAKSDITAGTFNYNPDLTNTALKDPTKITKDPNQLEAFNKQWNAQYSGPQSFETSSNYGDATSAANNAGQIKGELGTTGGREQLIGDQFGVYGQGNKGLDQALLQSSSYFPKVQEQEKKFGSVQDYLKQQSDTTNAQATKAAAVSAAAQTQTRDAFANNLTNFQAGINSKVSAEQAKQANTAKTYSDALKSGDPQQIATALKSSNLTDAQKTNLSDYLTTINKEYGTTPDLGRFYTANPATDVNAANVASAEDYANADAYQKLTGTDYSGVLNQDNVGQAGKLPDPNTTFNNEAADQNLRSYLVQKEMEALQPKTSGQGTSAQPESTGSTLLQKAGSAGAILNPVGTLATGGLAAGINSAANSISKSLFGAGKGDAQVTLPQISLPQMPIPKTANAATTKSITDVYNKPLNTAGSYHEGAVSDMVGRLSTLQAAFKSGQISKDEYNAYAQPLAQWTLSALKTIMSASSEAVNSVKPAYNQFVAGNYLTPIK